MGWIPRNSRPGFAGGGLVGDGTINVPLACHEAQLVWTYQPIVTGL